MAKNFGCKKYVLLAEEASGKIFMGSASAQMPNNLEAGYMLQGPEALAAEASYVQKQGGTGIHKKKIFIK